MTELGTDRTFDADRVFNVAERLGLRLRELAYLLHVRESTVGRWRERHQCKTGTVHMLVMVAEQALDRGAKPKTFRDIYGLGTKKGKVVRVRDRHPRDRTLAWAYLWRLAFLPEEIYQRSFLKKGGRRGSKEKAPAGLGNGGHHLGGSPDLRLGSR